MIACFRYIVKSERLNPGRRELLSLPQNRQGFDIVSMRDLSVENGVF